MCLYFTQNKLNWHIYRLLSGRTVSEELPKIPLFGPSLIHQLQLLGSQQHPQSRVLLTSFLTCETEKNSLTEINLDITGVIKGCNIFWGSKTGKQLQCYGRAHFRSTRNIWTTERRWTNPLNALHEAIHYSFIKFCIYYFSIWYEFFVHYALRAEKNYQHGLDAGPWNFSFFGRGDVSPTHSELCPLFLGLRQNNRSHLR